MASSRKTKFQLPPLDTGPVPLAGIREHARRAFLDVLDSFPGRKALVIDPSVSASLGMLDAALTELLAEHGVAKLQYLEPKGQLPLDEPGPADASSSGRAGAGAGGGGGMHGVMVIARATVENAQLVAAQLRSARARLASPAASSPAPSSSSGPRPQPPPGTARPSVAIIFVPRRTPACERVLEEEGVSGDVRCGELPLDLIPLDDDVLSLELDHALKECVVDGDSGPLFAAARAMLRLQALFGLIPRIQGKGPAAVAVRDMVLRMRKENPGLVAPPAQAEGEAAGGAGGSAGGLISRAVLIDREVDLITPMMSQITFEGLIDEVTGIRAGGVPWAPKGSLMGGAAAPPAAAAGGAQGGPAAGPITLLNSSDPYFKEFRDLPYHHAIARLQAAARDARKEYSELGSKGLAELKTFVKGLPKLFLLDRLTDIATPVAEQVRQQLFHDRLRVELDIVEGLDPDGVASFAEELMLRGADLLDVLRLMVAASEAGHGLPRKTLDMLRAEVGTTYGYEHALTLGALEKAGFLRASAGGRSPFTAVRRALCLMTPEAEDEGEGQAGAPQPHVYKDISHLYKGYAPLSIRLVEAAVLRGGWGPVTEALALLPGSHFDVQQTCDEEGQPADRPTPPAVLRQQQQQQAPLHARWGGGASSSGGDAGGSGRGGGAGRGDGIAAPSGTGAGASGSSHGVQGPPTAAGAGGSGEGSGRGMGDVVLVVFLGGCTCAEVSALRHLSTSPAAHGTRFLVLTTKMVTGRSLLAGFVDPAVARCSKGVGLQV